EISDIFFLEDVELEPVASGRFNFDVRERIRRRREEYAIHQALTPPSVVVGRFNPEPSPLEPVAARADVLQGIAASPGIATGRAKVILRSDDHAHVASGEILVAPSTDPAWTPYFISAAGVAIDQGGILSHGSIVAREYGVPAVTSLSWAAKVIRTGDLIQ